MDNMEKMKGIERNKSSRLIRITIPAKMAFNMDKFNQVLDSVAEKLGCPQCFSGFDCRFINELIATKSNVMRVSDDGLKIDTVPLPESPIRFDPLGNHGLVLKISPKANKNLDSIKNAYKALAGGLLGCTACHSGRDVTFMQEELHYRLNAKYELEMGGGVIING